MLYPKIGLRYPGNNGNKGNILREFVTDVTNVTAFYRAALIF